MKSSIETYYVGLYNELNGLGQVLTPTAYSSSINFNKYRCLFKVTSSLAYYRDIKHISQNTLTRYYMYKCTYMYIYILIIFSFSLFLFLFFIPLTFIPYKIIHQTYKFVYTYAFSKDYTLHFNSINH